MEKSEFKLTPPDEISRSTDAPPLLSRRTLTEDVDEQSRSEAELVDMVAAERQTLLATGLSASGKTAHTKILRFLEAQLANQQTQRLGGGDALKRLEWVTDVLQFPVPSSHRRNLVGKSITGLKRKFVATLRPFHIETLRPQQRFDLELYLSLKRLYRRPKEERPPELAQAISAKLEPLADPTKWELSSHRDGRAAQAINSAKRHYLDALTPWLTQLLGPQKEWNRLALDAVKLIADGSIIDGGHALRVVESLQALAEPHTALEAPSLLQASLPLWREIFRRQTDFNKAASQVIAELLGVRPVASVPTSTPPSYAEWCKSRDTAVKLKSRRGLVALAQKPLLSIITPTHKTPLRLLRACIESVRNQSYAEWELILVDDGSGEPELAQALREYEKRDQRIRAFFLPTNVGIARATNVAISHASGNFLCFLDHDDCLSPDALAQVSLYLQDNPATDVIYTDEDKLDLEGKRVHPFFKPNWSPDLLRSGNYVCHFLVVRRELSTAVGNISEGLDGAQDYDFILKLSEKTQRFGHIPEVLYHWRMTEQSMSQNVENKPQASDAGAKALAAHLQRAGVSAEVHAPWPTTYHVSYNIVGSPLVSIIVPFKDKPELLRKLVPGLLERTHYSNFELILISNNSKLPETREYLDELTDPRVVKLEWNEPFNYSDINNFGVQASRGELILFLNNDIEVLEPQWLDELIGIAQRPEVGAVGPKLVFPDGRIQHAGVVVGINGFAGHIFTGFPDNPFWTTFGHANWVRNYLAVTGACLMVRRDVFLQVGGYDSAFQVCGGDVDLCLRIFGSGRRIIYTPFAKLIHDESATRKVDSIPEGDFWASYASYSPWLKYGDPYYSPNLSLSATDGRLRDSPSSAQDLAVRVLARELSGSRARELPAGRAARQVDLISHIPLFDCPAAELAVARETGRAQLATFRKKGQLNRITWLIPYFRHPYGGVHTILRFGETLRRLHGVKSHFVIYDNAHASPAEAQARANSIFKSAPGTFQVMRRSEELSELPECDLAIATFWMSAYYVRKYPKATARAYFVQDYEPLFYQAGSLFGMAEESYRLGLFGIFNTSGLGDYIKANYPMDGIAFEPSVDGQIFYPSTSERAGPTKVFFYARPSVDRNAFELGISCLKELKKRLGKKVQIVTAGEHWNPEDYGVAGMIQNLGILPYEGTADLYRSCDIGLCFMFTKHPSYLPLEMMACGVTVVTNKNEANLWLLKHEVNCLLAQPTFSSVVEQLTRAVRDAALRGRIAEVAALRMRSTSWDVQIDSVYKALLTAAY